MTTLIAPCTDPLLRDTWSPMVEGENSPCIAIDECSLALTTCYHADEGSGTGSDLLLPSCVWNTVNEQYPRAFPSARSVHIL